MNTTSALSFRRMAGTSALHRRKALVTWVRISRSTSPSSVSTTVFPRLAILALHTRVSTVPKSATTASARPSAASGSSTDAALGLAEAVVADFGTVDTLVCNARIASRGNTVVDTELGEVDRLMRTHVTSAFLLCKALVPAMRLKKRADAVRFLVSPASGYLTGQV